MMYNERMAIASIIALIILLGTALFQLALIFEAPLGRFAWGGQHDVLPPKLRVSSGLSILIYVLIAAVLLSKAEVALILPAGYLLDAAAWFIFAYFALGVFVNAISRSKPERYVMTPVVLILAACSLVVALGVS